METHAFGFRLPANPPEGQKRFPISKSDFLSVSRLHRARAALRQQLFEKAGAGIREASPFQGPRCDRMVERVLARIRSGESAPRLLGRPVHGRLAAATAACPPTSARAFSCYRNRSARWTWQVGLDSRTR